MRYFTNPTSWSIEFISPQQRNHAIDVIASAIVPSASSRTSRFCTVPRATFKVLARLATGVRALVRNKAMSWWSRSSMGLYRLLLKTKHFALSNRNDVQFSGYSLAQQVRRIMGRT